MNSGKIAVALATGAFIIASIAGFVDAAHAGEQWSKQDVALEATYLLVQAGDWNQTKQISRDPQHYYETNPILGKHPSTSEVNRYFIGASLLHIVITDALPPKYRPYFQAVTISMEYAQVRQNYSIGLSYKF